eukprot:TRINITY_DN13496_c0_g1_i2.p1 TRINITY_DN13496_c0_g1~~TRINITY_DN13496_c0_g1_i2.p1  ORF type:complete len:179 (-),score=36.83 TRINITY_DN13496_c0_g1_i2:61-597(-)
MYFFFFFKQKTAYEMLRSLVGSEMCIRDRHTQRRPNHHQPRSRMTRLGVGHNGWELTRKDQNTQGWRGCCSLRTQLHNLHSHTRRGQPFHTHSCALQHSRTLREHIHHSRMRLHRKEMLHRKESGGSRNRRRGSGGSRCLLYTSDAADEEDSVDLGGRRIIKKKKRYKKWRWRDGDQV